jgi:ABC-type glycerol-3-phosphate transport system permease component
MASTDETTSLVPPVAGAVAATTVSKRAESGQAGRRSRIVAYGLVYAVCFFCLFPLYWMFENSLQADGATQTTVTLFPSVVHWENYSRMWNALAYPFDVFLVNSFVVAGLVTIGVTLSCVVVAYGFARFRFPGRDFLFYFIIATMMIPFAIMMIPSYALFINVFHWGSGGHVLSYQNAFQFLPQIVPAYFGSPVFIFLLRQFIRGIPYDLDEAAKIDGAGPIRILWTVIMPALRPAITAVVVLNFIGKWNDFLGPLIFLQDPHNWTIELALNGFVGRYATTLFDLQMAAALMSMLPIIIVYFFASKQIIEGVTLSGVKG